MPWDKRIEPLLDRYPALRAIGNTPLVPVPIFSDELPGVEVLAKPIQSRIEAGDYHFPFDL